jgi:hypothetical protein
VFSESRTWCVLTLKPGTQPVRALVEPFFRTWQFAATDPERAAVQTKWIANLVDGAVTLRDLLDATELRYRDELHQPKPPTFLLYIDQGEELYVRAEGRQRQCFSQILADGLADPRLRALMSLRTDFFGDLQKDELLYAVHRLISVPPLREAHLREVVSKPPALLGARFETDHLGGDIARRAAEESTKDAGALPLLSYLLDDMWKSKEPKWDGVLRLPAPAIELGRVLVARANAFLATHPDAEDKLRRIFTLMLSTVREDGEPTRRRALRSEFTDADWRLVSALADHPNRLLVTATTEGGETYAEVAHEAIFRRWDKLREWIASEREFLAWRTGVEAARRFWQGAPVSSKDDALLMGAALTQAQRWLTDRSADLSATDREFIELSRRVARQRKKRALLVPSALLLLFSLPALALGVYWWNQQRIINVDNNTAWAVTNFRGFPDIAAVSAMAATLGQKNILWGKPSADATYTLANIVATLPENTISSELKQADESAGFFLSGPKRFVFWSNAEGIEIVSWDGERRYKIPLANLVGKNQSSSSVLLENVEEGAGGTLLLRLSVGSERQIVEVLRDDGDVVGTYDTEYFIRMSQHAKDAQGPWRLNIDRDVVYLSNNNRNSLVAEAFFMNQSNEPKWASGLGWINYRDPEGAINGSFSFLTGTVVLMVYSAVPAGQLKDIVAFDLRHGGNQAIWSVTKLMATPGDQSAVSRCLRKNGCIFADQDHAPSNLLAIQVPENQPERVRDIGQRALKIAHLIVVDVSTGKMSDASWNSVLASAKAGYLGPEGDSSASQITNNLSVAGTIDSLIVGVPNGRVFDVFRIVANVPLYVGTYTASEFNGGLYFSADHGKMILINGHEAKVWDISKSVEKNAKSLEGKNLNELIQLACKMVPPKDVLRENWFLSGRRDDPPRIPCGESD